MRRAILDVSTELLVAALHLPADMRIAGIQFSGQRPNMIEVLVEHPTLKEVGDGLAYPHITAQYRIEYGERPKKVIFEWWNQ